MSNQNSGVSILDMNQSMSSKLKSEALINYANKSFQSLLSVQLQEKNIIQIIYTIVSVINTIDKKTIIDRLQEESIKFDYVKLWSKIKTMLAIGNKFNLSYSTWNDFSSIEKYQMFQSLCAINNNYMSTNNILYTLQRIDKLYSIDEILNKERENDLPNLKEYLIKQALVSNRNLRGRNIEISNIIKKYDLDISYEMLGKILSPSNSRIHNLDIYDIEYDKIKSPNKVVQGEQTFKDMIYYFDAINNIKQFLIDDFRTRVFGYDNIEYFDNVEYLKTFLPNKNLSNLIKAYLERSLNKAKVNKPFYQYCLLKVYFIDSNGGNKEKVKKI